MPRPGRRTHCPDDIREIYKKHLMDPVRKQSALTEPQPSAFESSLKSNDTEEQIDIWFYRPIGYQIALFCAKVGLRPNPVTIISIFFGVAAGILFYYQELWINVIGMLLLVFANSLD